MAYTRPTSLGSRVAGVAQDLLSPELDSLTSPLLPFAEGLLRDPRAGNQAAQDSLRQQSGPATEQELVQQLTPGARARLQTSGRSTEDFRKSTTDQIMQAMLERGDGKLPDGFAEALGSASLTELSMVDDLRAQGLDQQGVGELMAGGHVRLEDGGDLYKQWTGFLKDNPSLSTRSSSHYGGVDATQYGFRGSLFKEGLFGLSADPGKKTASGADGGTWMQLERSPADVNLNDPSSWTHLLNPESRQKTASHMKDYVRYQLSGKNQGPWGESEHTEKNLPLVLDGTSTSVDQSLHSPGLLERFKDNPLSMTGAGVGKLLGAPEHLLGSGANKVGDLISDHVPGGKILGAPFHGLGRLASTAGDIQEAGPKLLGEGGQWAADTAVSGAKTVAHAAHDGMNTVAGAAQDGLSTVGHAASGVADKLKFW